jgi:hypothetical protein
MPGGATLEGKRHTTWLAAVNGGGEAMKDLAGVSIKVCGKNLYRLPQGLMQQG